MKNWQNFERLVAAIHATEMQGAIVKWNDNIEGRQFDVTIRFKYGNYEYLTVIECKNYASKIPIEKLEAFITKSSDIKADKAILASSSGFQEGCFNIANRHAIILLTINDKYVPSEEYLKSELTPALNILNVTLISNQGDHINFDNDNKLEYILVNTMLTAVDDNCTISLIAFLTYNQPLILNELKKCYEKNKRRIRLDFPKPLQIAVPRYTTRLDINAVEFDCKLINARIVNEPMLDIHLERKLDRRIQIVQNNTGETRELRDFDIRYGYDTKLVAGKFYVNPLFGFFYYCDSIDNNSVRWILVESYQHGRCIQAEFTQKAEYYYVYVEISDEEEIKRLEQLLKEFRFKEAKNKFFHS